MHFRKAIGAGTLVGALGAGVAACAPVTVHWEKYPVGTSSSLRQAEQHWWVTSGGDDAVFADRDAATAATDASSSTTLTKDRQDGNALARDAAAAARHPYPGNPGVYVSIMDDLQVAGRDLAAGETGNALAEISTARDIAAGVGWAPDFPAPPSDLTS